MKTFYKNVQFKMSLLLLALISSVYSFAQDAPAAGTVQSSSSAAKTTTTTAATSPDWYMAPWVWIAIAGGGALFILLLVAISRSNGGSKKTVSVTKTEI
jgi:hypothetical protein